MSGPIINITRKASFSAAHVLNSNKFDTKTNKEIYGKCNNEHGHNYEIEITVKSEINPDTGMLMNFDDLKKILHNSVIKKVDHKHLNKDVDDFKTLVPTAENMAYIFWQWLKPELANLYEIKLSETKNSFVIYRGE